MRKAPRQLVRQQLLRQDPSLIHGHHPEVPYRATTTNLRRGSIS
jgi:hypothetical protein